jgi:hypothetical protein
MPGKLLFVDSWPLSDNRFHIYHIKVLGFKLLALSLFCILRHNLFLIIQLAYKSILSGNLDLLNHRGH